MTAPAHTNKRISSRRYSSSLPAHPATSAQQSEPSSSVPSLQEVRGGRVCSVKTHSVPTYSRTCFLQAQPQQRQPHGAQQHLPIPRVSDSLKLSCKAFQAAEAGLHQLQALYALGCVAFALDKRVVLAKRSPELAITRSTLTTPPSQPCST